MIHGGINMLIPFGIFLRFRRNRRRFVPVSFLFDRLSVFKNSLADFFAGIFGFATQIAPELFSDRGFSCLKK